MATAADIVQGKIQKQIGTFLSLKDKLIKLQHSQNPTIVMRANEFFEIQAALEAQLPTTLQLIDNVQKGAYSAGDLIAISSFALSMEKQIRDVNALSDVGGLSMPVEYKVGLVLLMIGAGYLIARRK